MSSSWRGVAVRSIPWSPTSVGATNGILYKDAIGKLDHYPIPVLRMPPGAGRRLLDIGCNWGRWSIAAARLGYRPIGIDPSLGAVLAAKRVSEKLGLDVQFSSPMAVFCRSRLRRSTARSRTACCST